MVVDESSPRGEECVFILNMAKINLYRPHSTDTERFVNIMDHIKECTDQRNWEILLLRSLNFSD